MVTATRIGKTFRTTARRPGTAGALRSLINPQRVNKVAVHDVSFSVAAGELVALLGPNGAGKSTTIKMLSGILRPTSGEISVNGRSPHRDRQRNAHDIGAVFGQRSQLWWDLPARESFSILRDIYGVTDSDFRRRLKEFDTLLELSEFWDTQVRHLSLGQRVRCDLAASLLHDPVVLYLDEPTIGMDVVVKEQVRGFLRHQAEQRGRSIVLTTHDMTEVARLAERVLLINHGRLVVDGSLAGIRRRFGEAWQLHATLADGTPGQRPAVRIPGVRVVRQDGPRVILGPEGQDPPTAHVALRHVVRSLDVVDVSIQENDLEDVIRAAYLEEGPAAGHPGGSGER
ncbi:ATP-binding cassette domain-containing protein [Streptomyces sp. PTY087I2]|uniref:ABC transporter ATP-binding protein n=1 Tax=Streptomyces sp. PTY087I2 TaxID=1819298 RepID=UPI00080B562C|nr:ATP-binding cassette domain-containing protein [Streptomyces sp. PTY087I2]